MLCCAVSRGRVGRCELQEYQANRKKRHCRSLQETYNSSYISSSDNTTRPFRVGRGTADVGDEGASCACACCSESLEISMVSAAGFGFRTMRGFGRVVAFGGGDADRLRRSDLKISSSLLLESFSAPDKTASCPFLRRFFVPVARIVAILPHSAAARAVFSRSTFSLSRKASMSPYSSSLSSMN